MSKQKPTPNQLTETGLARLIVLIMALLAWFALGAPLRNAAERRRFSRYGAMRIATLRKAVRNIIVIRAAELLHAAPPAKHSARIREPRFCLRPKMASLRAIFGASLRRQLKHRGSFFEQAAYLLSVLRDHRAFARRLAHLRRNLMRRLDSVIVMIAQPAAACVSLHVPAASAHDSS